MKPYNYRTHVAIVHEKEKTFKCNKCDMAFGRKDTLEKHIKRAHEKVLNYLDDKIA